MSQITSEPLKEEHTATAYSPIFLELRSKSIAQVTELMDSVVDSMCKVEKSLERLNRSNSGIHSTSRIWCSFYDPKLVEKMKKEASD